MITCWMAEFVLQFQAKRLAWVTTRQSKPRHVVQLVAPTLLLLLLHICHILLHTVRLPLQPSIALPELCAMDGSNLPDGCSMCCRPPARWQQAASTAWRLQAVHPSPQQVRNVSSPHANCAAPYVRRLVMTAPRGTG